MTPIEMWNREWIGLSWYNFIPFKRKVETIIKLNSPSISLSDLLTPYMPKSFALRTVAGLYTSQSKVKYLSGSLLDTEQTIAQVQGHIALSAERAFYAQEASLG